MKKSMLSLVFFLSVSIFNSCSKESDENDDTESRPKKEKPTSPEVVMDSYLYVALNSVGSLYEIGDKSGSFSEVGKVVGIDFNLFGMIATKEKYFLYQQVLDPREGKFFIYDKAAKTTQVKSIGVLSEFGEQPILLILDWDGQKENIIGMVDGDENDPESTQYLVTINPETLEVSPTGIEFVQNFTSWALRDNVLYLSSAGNQDSNVFTKIDLIAKTVEELSIENNVFGLTGLSSSNSSDTLFGFHFKNVDTRTCLLPGILDLKSNKFELIDQKGNTACRILNYGKSYFNREANEHVEIVNIDGNTNALMRFDIAAGKLELISLKDSKGDSNALIILDVKKL